MEQSFANLHLECKWNPCRHPQGFLEWLTVTQPDILGLQETKAQPEQLNEALLTEHGYEVVWHSAEKKGYSSVATFMKQKPLSVQKGLGIERFDREGRVICTEHPNFFLYNAYFPNGQHDWAECPISSIFTAKFWRRPMKKLKLAKCYSHGGLEYSSPPD